MHGFHRTPFYVTLLALVSALPAVSSPGRVIAAPPPEGEDSFFIPRGFAAAGSPRTLSASDGARLSLTVTDKATGEPTFCRINVVGPNGQFYQPPPNYLSPYALTGVWPEKGAWGNRKDKAPYRYLGRFFYAWGKTSVLVPAGLNRVEIWKGFEYRPQVVELVAESGQNHAMTVELERVAAMEPLGWHSGDPHLHLPRESARDDDVILDLLEAEDIRYGSILGYNEPAGPYSGFMEKLASPQQRGLGAKSARDRGGYHIQSGQEYRNTTYGHILLFNRDQLIFPGQDLNADNWPVYGLVARETMDQGGFAAYAHGGYRQEIYADVALGALNAIELLQFGIYREIGLTDWYHMLNAGYRIPCLGASDWPACRWLGDCRTYVEHDGSPDFAGWLRGMAEGRSFVTTGPLLIVQVDGHGPGERCAFSGKGPHALKVSVRLACEVTSVQKLDLIVNGEVVKSLAVSNRSPGEVWQSFDATLEITESSWIAARAWSQTPGGRPDAEAHTNPVYAEVDGKAVYRQGSLDAWVERIDGQIARQRQRDFPEKARVLDYFQQARDVLLEIRAQGGLKANDNPAERSADVFKMADAGRLKSNAADAFPDEEELREFLKPVPAKAPAEALATFETVPGFEMQLVAAEPLVFDPIASAFDADGNLYVCEMRDYPYKPAEGAEPIGCVRLLKDLDGDGAFESSTVFADRLLWAAGVVPWKGGVYVAAPPDIWYFRDDDGDGVADTKRKVFTGFGTGNQQGMLNNLVFGLDHQIYGATAPNGGQIRRVDNPDAPAVDVAGRDFRFNPRDESFETVTGTVQFGNTFDDFGNRFTCSESQPLLQIVLPQNYLARNPYLPVPYALKNLAPGPVPIYRTSPVERWRQIRSARRIATAERSAEAPGASHHVVDAAAGVTVYRGGAYPAEYYGTVFVGDGQNNLVHHRRLVSAGPTFDSQRVEEKSEFVRSTDIWFRPVNFINAPDGTLYCLDMSREVLESIHVPLDVARHLDFTSGRETGRIYRIAPRGFRSPRTVPLTRASAPELAAALESPNGWSRDTAHRLIYERQDRTIVPALESLVRESRQPATRVAALWSLQGLDSLRPELLAVGLRDSSAGVRENALRLSEPWLDRNDSLRNLVLAMGVDSNPKVQFQLAFTVGETRDPRAAELLAKLAKRHGEDPWIRTAILSSAGRSTEGLFRALAADPKFSAGGIGSTLLEQLAQVIGVRHDEGEIDRVLDHVARGLAAHPALQRRLALALGVGLKRAGRRLDPERLRSSEGKVLLSQLLKSALDLAGDSTGEEANRVSAVQLLACAQYPFVRDVLTMLLSPQTSAALQMAAVKGLGDYPEPEVPGLLIERFNGAAPEVRAEMIAALLSREERTIRFLEAAQGGAISAASVESTRRQLLLSHKAEAVRNLAAAVFGKADDSGRGAIVERYRQQLAGIQGDAIRGAPVFDKLCSSCHQLAGKGYAIGPNLASSPARDPAALVQHVLDPNQYVLPNFVQYVVLDRSGKSYSGMIAAQTATSITLKREKDASDTILRSDIDEVSSTGKSLMPEGLEKDLSPGDLADLIAYLQSQTDPTASNAPDPRRVRDKGTLPGTLIEPAGKP